MQIESVTEKVQPESSCFSIIDSLNVVLL